MPLKKMLKDGARRTLDIVYPVRCLRCHVLTKEVSLPLCPTCAASIERADLARLREYLSVHPQMSDRIAFVYAHWMFDKTGVVQLLHRNLKYGNRPLSGQALGRQIGKSLRASFSDDRLPDRIVPIPLHRRRFYERGYNQSFALAQGIRSATGIPLAANALFRRVHTQTQTGLGQFDRWKNVASAFEVQAPEVLSGRHVVVVDDVLTTGATLLAASNKLLEAGAHAVSFATLAFARP